MNILVIGRAVFIGSHVVKRLVKSYSKYHIYNLDALTYAGNLENLKDIESNSNYSFIQGDIKESNFINSLFKNNVFDGVIAAQSLQDRSITD